MGAIKREDVPVVIQTDDAEVRMSEVGEMTVAFFQLNRGRTSVPHSPGCQMTCASALTGAMS